MYQVSNRGNVRSLNRYIQRRDNDAFVFCKGVTLIPTVDRCGYLNVYLSKEGEQKRVRIHRLVAEAFIDNPLSLPQVNHRDGNKLNNKAENLEWVTNAQNQVHAIETGLKEIKFGKAAIAFTGTVEAYDRQGNMVASMSGNEEMGQYGFDYRLVSAVLLGKRKSHRGCSFVKLSKEENNNELR